MRLTLQQDAPATGQRGPGTRTTTVLLAIGLLIGGVGLPLGLAGSASAAPTTSSTFPISRDDCRHGGWADFTGVTFRNQGQCQSWVQHMIVRERCLPAALADFQETGPTYAAQLGIPLERFLLAVCHGQDTPVSNAWYVVNDPAGTDLLSLASGHTTPFLSQPGHIYWVQVQGAWEDGSVRQADAGYISDDDWLTWSDGPSSNPLNLQTQINGEFVDWGPYDTGHHYNYWVAGDGSPITLRVFDGDPATNTPNPARYTDNTGPVAGVGVPAIVFEYTLPTRHPWSWGWWRW
jgi:hypothetical protein